MTSHIPLEKIPQHVAVVMDGNGRWAKKRFLPRVMGHRRGVEVVKKMLSLCRDYRIRYLSLFAFSTENWSRPEEEVNQLMSIFIQALDNQAVELVQNNIRLRVIGHREKLPEPLQQRILDVEEQTKDKDAIDLILCANYGGHWDIVNACKGVCTQVLQHGLNVEDIDEQLFAGFLQISDLPSPDLLIRTSGEQRISNFYLWQLAYSELYFCDKTWPEFAEEDFVDALQTYALRQRRFGNVHHSTAEMQE